MQNRHSPRQNVRGRPPLPFRNTVSGRIYAQLGSLNSISQRLRFGGETAHDLLESIGFNPEKVSNERVSQIVGEMFKHARKRNPLSRSHSPQWRIARCLRSINGFQRDQEINSLAHQMTCKRWVMRATRRAGSFQQLLTQLGISHKVEKRLRRLLLGIGIHLPPKKKPVVKLQCRICHRTFTRSVSYERRFAGQRKKGPLCGHKHSVTIS